MRAISLFAGIGGFDIALKRAGHNVVYTNEWNKYAAQIYEKNFNEKPDTRSITDVSTDDIPDHDILVGGFPCQAFSIAGKRRGFDDTRGTLFFDIARILKAKQPRFLLLENVKGLLSHDNGRTFKTILTTLTELGYDVQWQVLNSKNFGVPQNRERVFIVGHLRGEPRPQIFPLTKNDGLFNQEDEAKRGSAQAPLSTTVRIGMATKADSTFIVKSHGQIKESDHANALDASYHKGLDNHGQRSGVRIGTYQTHKDGQGFREIKEGISPTIPARAREDGSGQPIIVSRHPRSGDPSKGGTGHLSSTEHAFTIDHMPHYVNMIRRLTPTECERLQGFPDGWTRYGVMGGGIVEISDTQRYKVLGNAVTVNVIEEIVKYLKV